MPTTGRLAANGHGRLPSAARYTLALRVVVNKLSFIPTQAYIHVAVRAVGHRCQR